MRKATHKITAIFEFSQSGNLKAVFLNAENEHDQQVLQKGLSHLVKPEKMGLIRRLFGMVTNGK